MKQKPVMLCVAHCAILTAFVCFLAAQGRLLDVGLVTWMMVGSLYVTIGGDDGLGIQYVPTSPDIR